MVSTANSKALAALLRAKATAAAAAKPLDDEGINGMPGECPYDRIVLAGRLTYAEAKTRHELLHISAEKIKQSQLETESVALSLASRKLEIEKERGNLVTVDFCIKRQDEVVSTFTDLVKMIVSECTSRLPASEEPMVNELITRKYRAAMGVASEKLQAGAELCDVIQDMQSVFRATK